MSKPLRYKVDGQFLTDIEIVRKAYDHAQTYPPEIRTAYLNAIRQQFSSNNMRNKFQSIYLPSFGIILMLLILAIVFFKPFPSQFQSGAFWLALSLASAACAALIPGFIEFKYQGMIKAGGALAVFGIVYLLKPSMVNTQSSPSSIKMTLYLIKNDTAHYQVINADFDKNNNETIPQYASGALIDYVGKDTTYQEITCFRKSDGKIYNNENCQEISEYEMILIPNSVIKYFDNKRQAYDFSKKLINIRF